MEIKYSALVDNTELLGPYNRAVLWVFGCCFNCEGCIAKNFKSGNCFSKDSDELASWFLNTGLQDITISGGEPMLQSGALCEMIKKIKEQRDVGVIVYTGFTYDELKKISVKDRNVAEFISNIDILIDGPYIIQEDHNEPYRGSANQNIIDLTGRYSDVLDEYYYKSEGRHIHIEATDKGTLMVGVPSKGQAEIWNNIKTMTKDV